jgi:hypothetical protein
MLISKLSKLHSHPEYGGKIIGQMTEFDLSKNGIWQGTFDELKQDIIKNGIQTPLEIDKFESGELNLKNGHHRAVIAIQIGLTSVPVIIKEGN